MKDYYKILQVAPDASTEVIQMAYKALAKKYHPDLNPGQEEAAQEKMKDVNEAYEILSDKDKRWQYDQIYYRQEKTAQKTSYSAPEPPKRAQTHSAQSKGEQTSAAPVDPTPEDKEKTSSGKGCAKTGCGCLVVFVVLFILIGLFGGSSSDSDSDKKPSSSDAASVTATSEMSVAASEAEEVKPKEELVYTLENLEKASSTYNKSENPYYKDSVAQYAEAINIIYGENTSQTVTEMTLEQALKDSDVSRLFVEKLLKLQGEDVMSDSDFYRMDVKTDSGIVKTLLTMESERQYMEVSSLPKDRIGDYEEILFYYGGMKENKPNGNGALFAYSTRNGLSLQYVGKFKDGKIEGKGISFTYDGLVHYLAHAGNYEKNMATGKMTTYYDNDCQAIGNFFLYKFGDYIDEMSEKWSEDELVRQIDLLLPQKRVLKLIVTVNLYESPSTTVDFNQRVLIPHIKYEGKMKKGSIEGKGKLYASDGWLAYDGEWKKDKYNGKGILYNQDGTIRKKGTFDNEAPDEELIYSNLATASLLESSACGSVCRHFHLSLQSGCDATLKAMNRKYDTARFYEAMQLLRRYFPDCGMTCDVIVGFPGETEEHQRQTLEFLKKAQFSDAHIFPYSRRPGTPADKMDGQIDRATKAKRSKQARAVVAETRRKFLESMIGKALPVLFETQEGECWQGHSDNYLEVRAEGENLRGTVHNVRIDAVSEGILVGNVI